MVLADYKIGYSSTVAPLIVGGKVIVGISGGEYPTRGFLDAYRSADRRARLALLHGAGEGRARQQKLAAVTPTPSRAAAAARG